MKVSFRKLLFRGEVGSRCPGVAEGELRGPADTGEGRGVTVFGVEVAAGLVEDSGWDVVTRSRDGGGFDAFAYFVSANGPVVVSVIRQK